MKKNEHYFPTMEFMKDESESCGWRRIGYDEDGKRNNGVSASLAAETMDEGLGHDEDGGDVEG